MQNAIGDASSIHQTPPCAVIVISRMPSGDQIFPLPVSPGLGGRTLLGNIRVVEKQLRRRRYLSAPSHPFRSPHLVSAGGKKRRGESNYHWTSDVAESQKWLSGKRAKPRSPLTRSREERPFSPYVRSAIN